MNESSLTILLAAGAAALLCWLILKSIYANKSLALSSIINSQKMQIEQSAAMLQKMQAEKEQLLQRCTQAETENEFISQQLAGQKQEMNQLSASVKHEFANLAQAIMEEKSQKFTEVNQQKLNDILHPFKIQLGEFKQKVEETYDKESRERFTLGREVERLVNMTQQVSQEANNLSAALKGNNKMQGNWGEMILESILENSGMARNREYFLQEFLRDEAGNVIKDENGRGLQPDAMVVYPDQRRVIIDSKVSLIAWDECCAQTETAEQKRLMIEHIRSIRKHIDGLQKKNYPRYAAALDYVLMFIPIEPAFLEALKADPSLWKYAYDRNILLVSPTNLFAVLRIVADLWKVEKQSRHAVEIADKAGSLYDKFAGFIDNFELLGKRISEANNAYEHAHKQLVSGRGNVTGRIEELKRMGANASKQLPGRILLDLEMAGPAPEK